MCQQVKGLGIPLKSSQIPHAATIPQTEEEEVEQESKFLGKYCEFLIDVANHIVCVILLIGKKEC